MSLRHLPSLLALAALATHGYGQSGVLTGQIRDSAGNPVPNATFQIEPMSGGDLPFVSGGFTNASGVFTTTITPVGNYRMTIFPLPAPQSLVVVDRIEDLVVSSTPNNLGTIVLQVGTLVTGRVVSARGTPLVEADLEFVGPSGQPLDFSPPSETNGLGRFSVAMPFGQSDLHITYDAPPPYYGPDTGIGWAPLSMTLDLSGPRELGDVMLHDGFPVSAALRRQVGGAPVEDALIAFLDSTTHVAAFVPRDKSDAFGAFGTKLAAGTYDMRISPRKSDGLAAMEIPHIVIPPGGPLGTIFLQDVLELTGRVRGADGSNRGGVDVSLVDSASGAHVFLGDPVKTKNNGTYTALVAPGAYDVTFSPSFTVPYGLQTVAGVSVPGDTQLDGTLPALPFFGTVGSGVSGQGGIVPSISATGGTPRLGNSAYTLHCSQGCGGATALAVFRMGGIAGKPVAQGGLGGQGSPRGALIVLSGAPGTPGSGSGDMALPIPGDARLAGLVLRGRFIVLDSAAPGGRAMTGELQATLQP